jgi:Protein of unknown function (DUF2867)
MAVLTKPNGLLGKAYMTAIRPFRYALVDPFVIRGGHGGWEPERSHRDLADAGAGRVVTALAEVPRSR